MPGMPSEGFVRVRLIGGKAAHLARADQFVPDEFFAGDSLKVVPELLKAVALCGETGKKADRWILAEPDAAGCSKCTERAPNSVVPGEGPQ